MPRFFEGFRGQAANTRLIWQEIDTTFPFKCDVCQRIFETGGKRWIGSSTMNASYRAAACQCPDCHAGKDPRRRKAPILTHRRTELD